MTSRARAERSWEWVTVKSFGAGRGSARVGAGFASGEEGGGGAGGGEDEALHAAAARGNLAAPALRVTRPPARARVLGLRAEKPSELGVDGETKALSSPFAVVVVSRRL
jgi:hypothetical protein